MNEKLLKNTITIPIPKRKVEIGLYFTKKKKLKRIKKEHFKEETNDSDILDRIDEFVWLDYKTKDAGAIFSFRLNEHPYLAVWWMESMMYFFLRKQIRIIRRIFTGEWQYWVEDDTKRTKKKQVFRKFNLSFRLAKERTAIELVISYEGRSQVILEHINSLIQHKNLDTLILKSVIYERECQPYKRIEDEVRQQLNKVYPILGRDIARLLDMEMPFVKDPYKLTTAVGELQMFLDYYIKHEKLKDWLGDIKDWDQVKSDDVFHLKDTSREMCFGQDQISSDNYIAFGTYGPNQLPRPKHFKVFFIYTGSGQTAKLHLEKHLRGEDNYKSLTEYSHIPLVYEEALNYEIKDISHIKEELSTYINQLQLHPEVQYMAFYLSPFPKYGIQGVENQYYYWVKEILLKRNIVSQVLEQSKIKGNINFWIPNISMAMVAKMGGIPWKLARETEDELIVGFGAFKSTQQETPYIGSSFCFDNEGRFQEFDCWSHEKEWALIGQLYKAIKEYQKKNGHIKRLVIHYYKELNKKEFRQVEQLLDRFDSDIPIIVVRINSTFRHKELVMDMAYPKKLPANGSYYHLQYHDYLLYINEREKDSFSYVKSAQYPLKVSLQSNQAGLFETDPEIVPSIMQQLYDFSLLHWRSINQPRLPVTIAYPEYLARIFPHFDAETLQGVGSTRLWFL
jgi:hypothetical protein